MTKNRLWRLQTLLKFFFLNMIHFFYKCTLKILFKKALKKLVSTRAFLKICLAIKPTLPEAQKIFCCFLCLTFGSKTTASKLSKTLNLHNAAINKKKITNFLSVKKSFGIHHSISARKSVINP